MNVRTMTQEQIRQKGLQALASKLGPVGMVRFLQQFETGKGDYSAERHGWLQGVSVDTLAEQISKRRAKNKKRR
jgi:hypothetical protein